MYVVTVLLGCVSFVLLIGVASIVPRRSQLSVYELQRRHDSGDTKAGDELEREQVIDDIVSLQRVLASVLLILTSVCLFTACGWLVGLLLSIVIAVFYGRIAKATPIRHYAAKFYEPYDKAVVQFVGNHRYLGKMIRYGATTTEPREIASREELEHVISEAGNLLSADEKKLLLSGLRFRDKTVESVMTPRSVIVGVPKTELVGPLMLDELHKTGHSRFPVYDKDIDHVVGILHIRELLSLVDKKSQTAEKVMEQKVYYIRDNQTLSAALAAFLKKRHHMFVVVNDYRETTGLITLEDVIEELLGREIIDEYDVYDDLRTVAIHEAKSNNNAEHGVDI